MQKIVTDDERRLLRSHFWKVVNSDPMLMNFPRRERTIFMNRMVDIEVAKIQEQEVPVFPPEGYEIRFFPNKEQLRALQRPGTGQTSEQKSVL